MQITNHSVVTIDYTLTNDQGEVIDSSSDGNPLSYIQGIGNIIPGLEAALEGKQAGDTLNVSIAPAQGYGERNDSLMQSVPRTMFESPDEIQTGMQFHTMTEDGNMVVVTVVEVGPETVTVDANHPLAGHTLNFDVTVVDVRPASPEEVEHGHVHGPGGHHH